MTTTSKNMLKLLLVSSRQGEGRSRASSSVVQHVVLFVLVVLYCAGCGLLDNLSSSSPGRGLFLLPGCWAAVEGNKIFERQFTSSSGELLLATRFSPPQKHGEHNNKENDPAVEPRHQKVGSALQILQPGEQQRPVLLREDDLHGDHEHELQEELQTAPAQTRQQGLLAPAQQLAQWEASVAALQASETSLTSMVIQLNATKANLQRANRELRTSAKTCARDVADVRENSKLGFRVVRDLLALLETVAEWTLTYLLALSKLEYTFTIVLLACGYIAVVIGIVLPSRLVFLPLEYLPPDGVEVPGDHSDVERDPVPARGHGRGHGAARTESG
ncbi:unnamed protein product, partial [Amoebophrya sp. A120]|eukprot:GSA120T00008856001.1